ncbi:NADH-quinone oxidoreductase subunit J [Vibrio parahaemolyticus]|nr:NADH-quinone oxidoreductase subunit J [Vibrio parahaemolyticus]MBM4932723.1 NADH-quinone oxidoreductase subunit J [Vibrio parahaemolyticus]
MNNFLLDFLALGAILSGILVITSKNPVISVLFLISVFVNVAGYLVLLGVGFIGISYLIVYVGAIAILFLFVVMMLNLQLTELSAVGTEYTQNLPLGTIIGSLFLFELVSIVPFTGSENGTFNISTVTNLLPQAELGILNWFNSVFLGVESAQYSPPTGSDVHYTFNTMAADTQFASFLQIQSIGYSIYTSGALWLIVASVILLLAMVGPITLSMNKTPANN